jgi:hypothetical protein
MTDTPQTKDIISKNEVSDLVRVLFREEALVIGGLVAVYDLDDEIVWRLMKNLDVIRRKTLCRIENKPTENDNHRATGRFNLKPHPAIAEFLVNLDRA